MIMKEEIHEPTLENRLEPLRKFSHDPCQKPLWQFIPLGAPGQKPRRTSVKFQMSDHNIKTPWYI